MVYHPPQPAVGAQPVGYENYPIGLVTCHPELNSSKFAPEIDALAQGATTTFDADEYASVLEFLQRLVHSGVDVSVDPLFGQAMTEMGTVVNAIPKPNGAVFGDGKINSGWTKVAQEGHPTETTKWIREMHLHSVDFRHDLQLQSGMNDLAAALGF